MPAAPLDQVTVTATNLTPIIEIITWFCLATSLLAFVTHAGIQFYLFRTLKVETWLVLLALVFCVAQSIVVLVQTSHGYGKPLETLSDSDARTVLKGDYAATILFFMSLGFSKLAIVAFIHNITPFESHTRINIGIGILTILWMISSVLVVAFQCSLPHPWERTHARCIDRLSWWYAVSILNIITEIALVTLELGIMAHIQTGKKRKCSIMSLFACRLLVLVVVILQLVFFHRESHNPATKEDLTLGYWRSAICNQSVQCLCIVTTCLPYTKVFMERFESGLMRLDDLRRRGEHTRDDSNRDYRLMDISRSTRDKTTNVSRSWNIQEEPMVRTSSLQHSNRAVL